VLLSENKSRKVKSPNMQSIPAVVRSPLHPILMRKSSAAKILSNERLLGFGNVGDVKKLLLEELGRLVPLLLLL
jgi:hypothetical protein